MLKTRLTVHNVISKTIINNANFPFHSSRDRMICDCDESFGRKERLESEGNSSNKSLCAGCVVIDKHLQVGA